MARRPSHVDRASHAQTKPVDIFTDAALVPATLAECEAEPDEIAAAWRVIETYAHDPADTAYLLDVVLGVRSGPGTGSEEQASQED